MSQAKLARLASDLVATLVPHFGDDRQTRDHVVRKLRADTHGGTRKEWDDVKTLLTGLARSATIRVQTDLAEGLTKAVEVLEDHRGRGGSGWEGEMPVQMSNLPQHVQLLLNLAGRPYSATFDFAHDYLHRLPATGPSPEEVLYREIMSDPFDGDHWGPGFDDEVREGWTDSDSEEEAEELLTPSSKTLRAPRAPAQSEVTDSRGDGNEERTRVATGVLRDLAGKAYWKEGGIEAERMEEGLQGWRQLTTGTSAMSLALAVDTGTPQAVPKVISAQCLQRELLFALSGRPGVMFRFDLTGECSVIPGHPYVKHFSPLAIEGILESFRGRSTQAATIRVFVADTLRPVASTSRTPPRRNRTKEAFAEACRTVLERYGHWIADLEASFVLCVSSAASSTVIPGVPAATTPLLLKTELESAFGSTLERLFAFLPVADSPVLLLDAIYPIIETIRPSFKPAELHALLDLFIRSAAPMWAMLGAWLDHGMPLPSNLTSSDPEYARSHPDDERKLEEEFFIKRDHDVSWADEDFWEAGFISDPDGWPLWLSSCETREAVMECGKARGLLQGLASSVDDSEPWQSLNDVLSAAQGGRKGESTTVDIADMISTYLYPICRLTQFQLRRVLEEKCGLKEHLDAIEGIMYMRGFMVMQEYSRWLSTQMERGQRWADFHVLTGTMRDLIENGGEMWLNPAALRIRTSRRTALLPGLRSLAAIRADYHVPFPLSQLFTQTTMNLRAEVFAFLLQLRCAAHLLQRAPTANSESSHVMHGLRHRLAWLVDTLWTWVTERVIELGIREYREKLARLTSFRAMIALELEHTRRMRDYCFLHDDTSDLRETIMSILDMTDELQNISNPLADASERSSGMARAGNVETRSRRRRRRHRKNDTSSDESVEDEKRECDFPVTSGTVVHQARHLVKQLDGLVRLLRDGVQRMAGKGGHGCEVGDVGATWGMLSFALEDWR